VPPSNPTPLMLIITGAVQPAARASIARPLVATARRAVVIASVAGALAAATTPSIAVAQRSRPTASADRTLASAIAPLPDGRCLDTAATIVPARLDDAHLVYVEQETVVANRAGRILVAGAPVFVWRNAGDHYDLLGLDSLFGMVVEPTSKFVRPIPSPLPGRDLKGMRAAALPDGWWLVTFAEVVSVQTPKRPNVIAMWVGETDGTSWRALEKLPVVSDTLDPLRFSALAMREGRVRLAAPVHRDWRRPVVLYSRDHGHWTVRVEDLGLSEYAAITATASLDLIAVVRPDTTIPVDRNSLFLYSKAPTDSLWTSHPRLWHGGENPVHLPQFASDASQPLLLWTTGPMFRRTSAWALSLATLPESATKPMSLPTYASSVAAASRADGSVIVTFDRHGPTSELRIFEYREPQRASLVYAKPTEYHGLVGVALTTDHVVLIASKPAVPLRDPAVISMIETHAWRCP
jgi:hypothetical protein